MPLDPFFTSEIQLPAKPLSASAQELFDAAVKRDLRKKAIRPSKKRFDSISERERQNAAIERLNGF